MYDIEKLYQAKDVPDAIAALTADPQAIIISGGSDVLIKIREGKLAGCSLVSIHGIKELEGVTMEEDGTIVIGPATTFSHVTYHKIIQKYIPMLGDAVDQVGGPQIRNIGTIGGNISNGVTSADSASTLFAMNGRSVTGTVINGKVLMKNRELVADEAGITAKAKEQAASLWHRLND